MIANRKITITPFKITVLEAVTRIPSFKPVNFEGGSCNFAI